jgi:rubredoxin
MPEMSDLEKAPVKKVHTCHQCGHIFEISRHERRQTEAGRMYLVDGTSTNMMYMSTANREYAKCPECKAVEPPFSAEARDQIEDAGYDTSGEGPKESP